jgi:hypothetical protein
MTGTTGLSRLEVRALNAAYDAARASKALATARADQEERPHAIMPAAQAFRDAEHSLNEAVQALVRQYEQEMSEESRGE